MSNAKTSIVFDIFINYRREDTRADAGRLYDRLSAHFGPEHVFMDIDDIDPGQNFTQVLEETLGRCSVVIAVIGRQWLDCQDEAGRRRLDDSNDFIQLEIRRALERKIILIPVLVGGSKMPAVDELPVAIADLALQQAFEISDTRFHADVDALIDDLETADKGLRHKTKVSKPVLFALSSIAIVLICFLLYWGVASFQADREIEEMAQKHLDIGDRFVAQENYEQAISEYSQALEIEPNNIELHRKLITAKKQRLMVLAFSGAGTVLDIGLRLNYQGFAPVPGAEVDDALHSIYQLQALDPGLKDDVALMFDEAAIWKTSGSRSNNAIPLLQKATEFAPNNSAVLAELGLLSVLISTKPDGMRFLRRAIDIQPNEARYHFYLARVLAETYVCPYAGYDYKGSGDAEACAEAIRAYLRAADLATGDDRWSRQIQVRSVISALNIFHRYARKEKDILTANLAMTVDERIQAIEYLITQERRFSTSRNGNQDYPRFWLALLYEAKNDLGKAGALLQALMEETGRQPGLWLRLYARILEKSGSDPENLAKVKAQLKQNQRDE
tara:strand:+ start:1311 stop:2984 length:1674 start_codon:yes stop_codon:yes gene_type:complete